MALVQAANRNMNVRRAQVRQDLDKKRMNLDKMNIFTKHANETRTKNELAGEMSCVEGARETIFSRHGALT